MIANETTITRHDSALFTTVEDVVLMMDIDSGAYYELGSTAARIWQLLETPMSFGGLCDALTARYSVDRETCRAETERFVEELSALKLVSLV